jgi:hypothetical protein
MPPRHGTHRLLVASTVLAVAVVLGSTVALTAWLGPALAQSGEHGDGHAAMHDIYKNWHPPGNPGTSCCNNADCRPTRAFVDDEGHWRAWNGSAWLLIPQERVLPANFAGDGRSHICEKQGFVYCFTPGEIRG